MTFASYMRREHIVPLRQIATWRRNFERRAVLDCRCYGQHSYENESRTEIRTEPFIRAVFVLDKTCSYNFARIMVQFASYLRHVLFFPRINGPNAWFRYNHYYGRKNCSACFYCERISLKRKSKTVYRSSFYFTIKR